VLLYSFLNKGYDFSCCGILCQPKARQGIEESSWKGRREQRGEGKQKTKMNMNGEEREEKERGEERGEK
jgi:hypothetical protein